MQRNDFLKHLKKHNCTLMREGGSHSWVINKSTGNHTIVPRHSELSNLLCKIICKQLDSPSPK